MTVAERYALYAALAALGVWGVSKLFGRRQLPPPSCDVIGESGGVIGGMRYLERRSQDAEHSDMLPMVVLFHSRAATPEGFSGFAGNIKVPARVILPEGPGTLAGKRSWFTLPARTDDQAELAAQMEWTRGVASRFLRDVRRCIPTAGKVIVTGSSQGGSMSYMMASDPSVRGAVALAGWLPQALWTTDIAPTIGLHGDQDTTVPYARTAEYAAWMRSKGAPFGFETFNTAHGVSSQMATAWRDSVNRLLALA